MKTKRRQARELALQMLYQVDLNTDIKEADVRQMIRERLTDRDLERFCFLLFSGVAHHLKELDTKISTTAERWKLGRIAPTDRATLRLGLYEMLYTDTPPAVVINEALELAKRFGNAKSPAFINGILDRLNPQKASPMMSNGVPSTAEGEEK